ncbi:MAG TPA: hemin uptake protein HemP [Casimicrobiaceae bacterium]|nr:hemin uptake protein HemP [Casimicrobiaceae bacterium]
MSERRDAGPAGVPAADGSPGREVPKVDSPRVINSDILFSGSPYLAILHNQTIYFLRQTRLGKLILTK